MGEGAGLASCFHASLSGLLSRPGQREDGQGREKERGPPDAPTGAHTPSPETGMCGKGSQRLRCPHVPPEMGEWQRGS